MRTKLFALTAIAAFMTMAPAYAANADTTAKSSYEAKDNGGYVAKEKTETTDTAGTTTERDATKKVSVDNNGDTKTTVETKSSTDPKGLMNKTSVDVKNTATAKDGKTTYKHKKIVNGKTVEDNSSDTDTTAQ